MARGNSGQRGNSANSQGHQAERQVWDAEGNPVTGMNQTDWQNRNKADGLTRDNPNAVEEAAAEDVVVEPGTEEEPAAPQGGDGTTPAA